MNEHEKPKRRSTGGKPQSTDIRTPMIVKRDIKGRTVYDANSRGGVPQPGGKPSQVKKYIGRYKTHADAMAAFEHYVKTGERLKGTACTRHPHAPTGTRTYSAQKRITKAKEIRYDVKGRTAGDKRLAHLGTVDDLEKAHALGKAWIETGIIHEVRQRRAVVPGDKIPKARKPPRPKAPKAKPTEDNPRPTRNAIQVPPRAPDDPRNIRPGETRTEWIARLYRATY